MWTNVAASVNFSFFGSFWSNMYGFFSSHVIILLCSILHNQKSAWTIWMVSMKWTAASKADNLMQCIGIADDGRPDVKYLWHTDEANRARKREYKRHMTGANFQTMRAVTSNRSTLIWSEQRKIHINGHKNLADFLAMIIFKCEYGLFCLIVDNRINYDIWTAHS